MSLSGASPLHGTLTPAGWAPRGRGSDGDTESRLCWRDPWRWRRPGMVSWVAARTRLWGRLSLGERSSMLEPACAGGGGEARNGPHDPSLLEHTWHLSPRRPKLPGALLSQDGAVSGGWPQSVRDAQHRVILRTPLSEPSPRYTGSYLNPWSNVSQHQNLLEKEQGAFALCQVRCPAASRQPQ